MYFDTFEIYTICKKLIGKEFNEKEILDSFYNEDTIQIEACENGFKIFQEQGADYLGVYLETKINKDNKLIIIDYCLK